MKLHKLFLLLLLALSDTAFCQDRDTSFQKEWIEIDTMVVKQDLTRPALAKLDLVYEKAQRQHLPSQIVRVLLYRIALENKVTDNNPSQAVDRIRAELTKTKEELQRAMLYTLLAKQYQRYFDQHRWGLYNRKNTARTTGSIETWGISDFNSTITQLFRRALANKTLLSQTPAHAYDAVILKGNAPSLRPTLYDVLAHEALDYFKEALVYGNVVATTTIIHDPAALGDADSFVLAALPVKDSSAAAWNIVEIFRSLLQLHRGDADRNALADIDLERLEWVYNNAGIPERPKIYVHTLEEMLERYGNIPATLQARYLLAKQHADAASFYRPFGDTTDRYEYNNALRIIKEAPIDFTVLGRGARNLQSLRDDIIRKELHTEIERVNIPGEPFRMFVGYRNTDTIYVRIVRLDSLEALAVSSKDPHWKPMLEKQPVRVFSQALPATNDHQLHGVEIKVDQLPLGSYVMLISDGKEFDLSKNKLHVQLLAISNISYIHNGSDFFVLERVSGKPIQGAEVAVMTLNYSLNNDKKRPAIAATLTTNANGLFHYNAPERSNISLLIKAGKDQLDLRQPEGVYDIFTPDQQTAAEYEAENKRMLCFTDRGIYRPGQTVFFKVILVTKDFQTKASKLVSGAKQWLYLADVNGQRIDSVLDTPNEFGSFAGSFRLPSNALTGSFSLDMPDYSGAGNSFRVEEYKRPVFSVGFEKVHGAYRLNDSVTVTGSATAFAGNRVDGATVSFSIRRTQRYSPRWIGGGAHVPNADILHGTVQTDVNGRFVIRFKTTVSDIADPSKGPDFNFIITADVTDITGETHSAATTIAAGNTALQLRMALPAVAETDSLASIRIFTTNLSGDQEPATVHMKLYALNEPHRFIRKRFWERPDQFVMGQAEFISLFPDDEYEQESDPESWSTGKLVSEQTVNTKDTDLFVLHPGMLTAGFYRVVLNSADAYGNVVTIHKSIQLFNRNTLADARYAFQYAVRPVAEPGETASFIRAGMPAHHFVIRSVVHPNKQTDAYQYFDEKNGWEQLSYTPDERDRGNVNISEAYVFHNRLYAYSFVIAVPWKNKSLDVSYATFRNKTEPGSGENWTVTVKDRYGNKAGAELLTTMYDASLDQFNALNWPTGNLWNMNNLFRQFSDFTNFRSIVSVEVYQRDTTRYAPALIYDKLASAADQLWKADLQKWGLNKPSARPLLRDMNLDDESFEPGRMALARSAGGNLEEKVVVGFSPVRGKAAEGDAAPAPDVQAVITRRNFTETAFFFPQLYADTSGNYSFRFTMPESLTEWWWLSFAHTQALATGMQETRVVTQKKLMVQSNAPRFLREGDHMEFSSKVVNLTTQEITGQAVLELIDPENNHSVDGWFQNVFPAQYFTVGPGQSFALKFPVQVPFGYNRPLTWRITAKAGNFSDGEENNLPVLTNRLFVTETLPLFLPKDTTLQLHLDKLLNNASESLTQQGITVEYSTNPSWYAVQALPYLMEYPYDCVEQVFNKFYATALAANIVGRNAAIRKVFGQWAADTASLRSNLQKNESLKQILIQETPWVLQSENETQQKKDIAQLFDPARLDEQSKTLVGKLLQAQLPDGSFSWFAGGPSDAYMATYILTGIGKLKKLGALTSDVMIALQPMLVKTLHLMDARIMGRYNELPKNKKVFIASYEIVDYLYMRSFFRDVPFVSREAYDYFFSESKKTWINQNFYSRAKLALVYYRSGEEKFAIQTILPSILENAVQDPKLGIYWKSPYTNWWYTSPVEHQSMMITMAAELNTGGKLDRALQEMKTWLLLNKQTNNWKTTVATADACYALLASGTDWLDTRTQVQIRLGPVTLSSENEKQEAGTGHFSRRIDAAQVTNELGNITITTTSGQAGTKNGSSPSWGSVHWQYLEDMNNVTQAGTPLSVRKTLFVERNSERGKVLDAVADGSEIKTGDKIIVRLELHSDRDMEYVHLKDLRAAAFEPINVLSAYKWQGDLGYYETTRDVSSHFFISHLSKGTYVLDYALFATQAGTFSAGVATVECMYAPEFTAHSAGMKIDVRN